MDPKLIVALGRVPSEHLLQREVLVTKEAGEVELVNIGGVDRAILICIHPAATPYNPNQKVIFESAISKAVELVGLKEKEAR